MKKIILCLISLFLLSGCNVNYELTIGKDKVIENVTIIGEDIEDNAFIKEYEKPLESYVDTTLNSETNEEVDGVSYYDITKSTNELGNYVMNLKYNFPKEDLQNSNILNLSLSQFFYEIDGKEIKISTGLYIKAFEEYNGIDFLNVKIYVDSNYDIISTNASSNENNTLTWYIDQENYKKSPINLTIKEKDKQNSNQNNSSNSNQSNSENNNQNNINNQEDNANNNALIVTGVLFLFIIALIVLVKIKNSRKF